MDNLFYEMLEKDLITVESTGLTELQEAVNRLLNLEDFISLLRTSKEYMPIFIERDSTDEPGQLAAGLVNYEADENWFAIRNWLRRN